MKTQEPVSTEKNSRRKLLYGISLLPLLPLLRFGFLNKKKDEYKEYYYIREPQIRHLDFGDVSAQNAIREKLQCKPFKWFMEEIAYDLVKKFPLPPKKYSI